MPNEDPKLNSFILADKLFELDELLKLFLFGYGDGDGGNKNNGGGVCFFALLFSLFILKLLLLSFKLTPKLKCFSLVEATGVMAAEEADVI